MNRLYESIMRGVKSQIVRAIVLTLALGALALTLAVPVPVLASGIVPPLGTAGNFGVLASSTVTNTGPTNVTGDLGVSPGTAVTGFPPGIVIGTIHGGDAVAAQAHNDAGIAYNNIVGQACDFDLTGQDLGGLTLTPGVYCFASSAQLTGQLTLDGQNNPNSVFLFQIGSTLTTASNAVVSVINGTQPCRVFFQVSSSATLGTNTHFQGNILALTSITLNTGATTGTGLYALNGAVTLDTNDVQAPACASVATSTSTASATSTATTTPTTTALLSTNTSTPTATNTLALVPTNTTTPSFTNTPTNAVMATNTAITAIATLTTGPTNTQEPGATSTPASTALSTNTVTLSTPTLMPTLMPLSTQTSSGPTTTPTAPKPNDTPTQILTTQTPVIPTQISTPHTVPLGPPLLPPTGGNLSWIGPFTFLLSAMMLAMGFMMRRISRKQGEIRELSNRVQA